MPYFLMLKPAVKLNTILYSRHDPLFLTQKTKLLYLIKYQEYYFRFHIWSLISHLTDQYSMLQLFHQNDSRTSSKDLRASNFILKDYFHQFHGFQIPKNYGTFRGWTSSRKLLLAIYSVISQ